MKISQLKSFKHSGEKITCLTAYDASFAETFDNCGVDIILVGDSMANVLYGFNNTNKMTLENIIQHTLSVKKGVKKSSL